MPENINEQLNIADVNGGNNNEGGKNSRLKFDISVDNLELSKATNQLNDLHAMVAGDKQVNTETLQKIREQILTLQNKGRETITAHNPAEVNENTRIYIGPLFPGIFANKNIEHIYTSYPEGRIEQVEMIIGDKNEEELKEELADKTESNDPEEKIYINDFAKEMLSSQEFSVVKKSEQINLVRLKVSDLGLAEGVSYEDIFKKAGELGLELCPSEVGPQLRLKYEKIFNREQALDEYLCIGMKQISTPSGSPCVFLVFRGDDGRCFLSSRWPWSTVGGSLNDEFIFQYHE